MLLKVYHQNLIAIATGLDEYNNIYHICKIYREIVSKKQTHHGRKFMVNYMKNLNSIAERYAMYQPIDPIKFHKSDGEGFPHIIRAFKPYLRNDNPNVVKITLSIFRSCELFRLPPSHDISTVVKQPNYDEKVVEEIIQYIPKFVKRLSKPQYRKLVYHYTVKNGPNGSALANSDSDLCAVKQDIGLYDAIRTVSSKLGDTEFPSEEYYIKQKFNNGIHSRLTQFGEKAGKTRTIAVVDYYSQRALYPLHHALMSMLRKIPSDGTFSHRSVGNYAKEATKNKSYIATSDMTAFTDLFPSIIQRELLYAIEEDRELAQAWWKILSDRTFTVAWSGDQVKYGTGQPMGAYASWPLCTLAHHLVMHYCAYKQSIKNVNKYYRILGDDNERTLESLSIFYEETLHNLGCELNPSKGTCSREGVLYSSAEVAKRLYLNGLDISPITPGIIRGLLNPALLNNALEELIQSFELPALPVHILETVVPKKHRDKAWMLCTNPFNGVIKPGMPGYDENSKIWIDFVNEGLHVPTMQAFRIQSLMDKANAIDDDVDLFMLQVVLRTNPVNKQQSVGGDMELNSVPPYAMTLCQKHILSLLKSTIDKIQYFGVDDPMVLEEVEYLADPRNPFKDSKDVRNTHATLLVEKVYTFLQTGQSPTELLDDVIHHIDSPF